MRRRILFPVSRAESAVAESSNSRRLSLVASMSIHRSPYSLPALLLQSLAEGKLVRNRSYFLDAVFRRRSGLRKVSIAELKLGEDLRHSEGGAEKGVVDLAIYEKRE